MLFGGQYDRVRWFQMAGWSTQSVEVNWRSYGLVFFVSDGGGVAVT